jgi:hypothetical protein
MTNELREETNVKTKVQHNLQNPSLTYQQSSLKKEQETYTNTNHTERANI